MNPVTLSLRDVWRRSAAAITLVAAACSAEDRSPGQASGDPSGGTGPMQTWIVEPTPVVAVGDSVDSDTQVLGVVSDARWLPDGRVVVADAGAFAVIHFDAKGAVATRVGRKGRGPGEFADAMTLVELPGDSVAAWDPSQLRWTVISSRTGAVRNAARTLPSPTLLHAGLLVYTDRLPPPAWVPRLLSGLSAASAEVRVAHLDERGLLWVSQDSDLRHWLVYTDSAPPIASTMLPSRVRALHFQRGAVVGIAADSTGLERVVVHRIRLGAPPTVDLTPMAPMTQAAAEAGSLKSVLRNSVMAQEMHYMKANGYTVVADSLNLELPPGMRFKIINANTRGWRGIAWSVASGYTCAIFIGQAVPGGWSDGEPRCGP